MLRDQTTGPNSIRVLDPAGLVQHHTSGSSLAMHPIQWPETLHNKKFGFLSNGKPNVENLCRIFGELLVEHGGKLACSFTKEGPVVPAGDDIISALAVSVDIVVMGVCDGGTAVSWGIQDALILANQGVPVVLVCSDAFVPLARSIMPLEADGVHLITVPHPFSSLLEPEVGEIAKNFVTALDNALTTGEWPDWRNTSAMAVDPIEQLQAHHGHSTFSLPDEDPIVASQALYQRGLTDGLPVGIPTPYCVDAALSSWSGAENMKDIAIIPPRNGRATPTALATNAVLAGLPSQLLPYLAATIKAACQSEFNLFGLQTTTNPATPVIVVGGPRRQEFGFNHGLGALGPGNMANATLGRALRLCMQNLGGARVGDGSDPGTMGQPGKYTFCFAADEETCPWLPLRLQTDPNELSLDDDTVTLIAGTGSLNMIIKSTSGKELLAMISSSIRISGSNDYMFGGHPLLILCPEHMAILKRDGFGLTETRQYLFEHTKIPFSEFLPKNQEMMLAPRAHEFASFAPDTAIPMVENPSDFLICAAGGPSLHSTFVPSFGGSHPVSAKVKF